MSGCHVPWLAFETRKQILQREKSHRVLRRAASFWGWTVQSCTTWSTESLVAQRTLPVVTRVRKKAPFHSRGKLNPTSYFNLKIFFFPVSWIFFFLTKDSCISAPLWECLMCISVTFIFPVSARTQTLKEN